MESRPRSRSSSERGEGARVGVAESGVLPRLQEANDVPADALGWIVAAGAGNVLGLLLEYRGFRIGKVAIVAPIASTEGAIAALMSVAAGERIAPRAGVTLAIIAAGVVLAASGMDGDEGA